MFKKTSSKVQIQKGNKHDLSHQHLTTIDFFRLQPVMCTELIASDKVSFDVRALIEAAPLATKVYGSCHLDLHAFFVPFRLLWNNWNSYYYGDNNPNVEYSLPYCPNISDGFARTFDLLGTETTYTKSFYKARRAIFGSLGYPTNAPSPGTGFSGGLGAFSLMPARAYQLIYWDWFRDSANIPEYTKSNEITSGGGKFSTVDELYPFFKPRYRSFRKDYLSTLLTSTQAGVDSSVVSTAETEFSTNSDSDLTLFDTFYNPVIGTHGSAVSGNTSDAGLKVGNVNTSTGLNQRPNIINSLRVPVLRGAISAQRFLERLGITGTRSLERIKSSFGIRPNPDRLDMSEFIGYKSIPIAIDGLVNTGSNERLSSTDNAFFNDEAGSFGVAQGYASTRGQTEKFSYHAQEHGYLMVIASVIPDYIQGDIFDPLFTRGLHVGSEGPKDFFQPDYDGSGYEAVSQSQLIMPNRRSNSNWNTLHSDRIIGYQPYAESYRQAFDKISGDFDDKDTYAAMGNMAFINTPTWYLNPASLVAGLNLTTPTETVAALFDNHFQVTSNLLDHFVLNLYFVIDAIRPVSASSIPTELSDLSNSIDNEISQGGIRL